MERSSVAVGRFTYGHDRMTVRQWKESANLRIGDFCSVAKGLTVFLGGGHRTDWITTFPFGHIFAEELGGTGIVGHPTTRGGVTIGSDVWIASNVTIFSGVATGDGAVIGGNATVTRDVGPFEGWAGNPARKIRDRF
ncbi:Chloramphenicol acetyltransferase [Rhodobacteraceae bacterium THAF1]|uniref:CatB-related O-acetyltransferase n=1 Tax=Palleronia sp. THAF1 TaxID=2587842 RepID=UPI000F3B4707|nr:CatB-related O-acetyltransferase [Palleronia sp. THAF1]QFU08590.1 Chloramphenicol acetyltransferase [Palleronia sp. THAF1]VDC30677.1 Chloramphenicol acetyltransferase [Rhodobacteraceae bacterium THAF1]